MSTQAWLFWTLVFSSIGCGYLWYGWKQRVPVPILCGIAMNIYPLFVDSALPMIVIGVALMAIPYFFRR